MKTTALELALALVVTVLFNLEQAFAQEPPAQPPQPAAPVQPEAQPEAAPAPRLQITPKPGPARAQESTTQEDPGLPPIPDSLAEMIEIAMDHNPEILQAEAAVRQAETELNRIRLEVTRELTEQNAHYRLGLPNPLRAAKEAELRYLLGLGMGGFESESSFQEREAETLAPEARPSISPACKQKLENTIDIDFSQGAPLSEILEFLSEYLAHCGVEGMNFIQDVEMTDPQMRFELVTDTSIRDCLLAMADQCGDLCFLVRDFGILATTRERAETINAPCIPEDVPLRLRGPIPPQPRPQVPEGAKITEALNAPISLNFGQLASPVSLPDVLDFIAEYLEINITIHQDVAALTTIVKLDDAPLTAALRALCDQCESLCFVIRDYGILATTRERAERIAAPTIPEDVPLLVPVIAGPQPKTDNPEPEKQQ